MRAIGRTPLYREVRAEIEKDGRRTLDVGCGRDKLRGAVGIDIAHDTDAEIIHDLTLFPWPVADNSFDVVRLWSVIEHLPDTVRTMAEVHRLARPGATVLIGTPHFSSANAFTDPTHIHFFSARFLDYFIEGTELFDKYSFYSNTRFRLLERQITLAPFWTKLRLTRLMNAWLPAYETYLSGLIRGADIMIKLAVVK
jgi:SAM-dependent methyltransferase